MAPVRLPQYVNLKGDNGKYVTHNIVDQREDLAYLCLNSTERDESSTHEVYPVQDQENVVMLRNGGFWRRGLTYHKLPLHTNPDVCQTNSNWIWSDMPGCYEEWNKRDGCHRIFASTNRDCLFQLYQISPTVVALKCLGNDKFVKCLTTKGKVNALNASHPDSNDRLSQFVVSEGISARRVFQVEYSLPSINVNPQEWIKVNN